MRLALVLVLAIPRIAAADWRTVEDTDCRCELALPDKPVVSARPSPWPKLPWHRSEARVSATEWYAVSYIAFDKVPPAKALDTALVGLHGTIVSRTNGDARVKLADGTTIAVRFVVHERRIYAVEAGDVAKGVKPDKLFAGFHAWTDKDAPPEGTVAPMTGAIIEGGLGGLGGLGIGGGSDTAPVKHSSGSATTDVSNMTVAVDGKLDRQIARRYLRRVITKLSACYDQTKAHHPELGYGTIKLTFTVDPSGKVSSARARGIDDDVAACVAGVVGALELPKPTDGAPATVLATFDLTAHASH
ncbi:MAG TPA: AgmX/PglI C-terminal domain-containing protein [Kofleriaceae bacterium]|jgi:hypothetical protein